MMKRFTVMYLFVLLAIAMQAQTAKYVFYFIGDGMGINQVNGTEMYLAEQEGRIGTAPLLFANFPVTGYATTYSASNSITDSAAAGTALATGNKTYNSAIGVDSDKSPVESIAEQARKAGKRVGIATSVSLDHATPASFYAHQPNRNYYYEIAQDLIKANFDFYAGSGFLKPHTNAQKQEVPDIFPQFEEAGYTLSRGLEAYKQDSKGAKKMILIQDEKAATESSLPYAIDRKEGDLTLKQITESAIDFLMKEKNKGFFLMVEGGQIDWACHGNDPATAFEEVKDMDEAIAVAYEFYKKHPNETLIVVTADHETGGMGLGNGKNVLHLKNLKLQKQSQDVLSHEITNLRRMRRVLRWDDMKEFLAEKMGFWKDVELNWEQEKTLRNAFEDSFVKNHVVFEESLYAKTEPLAVAAKKVMNELALIGWTSPNHTAGYVPVYAIGAGSKLFAGKMDNTDIPKRIVKAAKY